MWSLSVLDLLNHEHLSLESLAVEVRQGVIKEAHKLLLLPVPVALVHLNFLFSRMPSSRVLVLRVVFMGASACRPHY